jgi:hypothetical protein
LADTQRPQLQHSQIWQADRPACPFGL